MRVCYYYHIGISYLSLIVGYGLVFVGCSGLGHTIAMQIIMGIVICILITACFFIGPLTFLSAGVVGRFWAALPLIDGNYDNFSIALFFWGIFNVFTIYPAIRGRVTDEINCFLIP